MIKEFVTKWDKNKGKIRKQFEKNHPTGYDDIVKAVVSILEEEYEGPDSSKIHEINDGDWQGTLLYVIPEKTYQPSTYWYVKISYGSCSVCDAFQGIRENSNYDDTVKPESEQVDGYMTLALHILQGLKKMN